MKKNAIFDILIGLSLLLALFLDMHIGLLVTCILFFIRGIKGLSRKKQEATNQSCNDTQNKDECKG